MKAPSVKPVRCAIYTRVSTDHGLDQEFNSLDAQYDAASAYIKSQAHAGWTLIRSRYDGGYSGGPGQTGGLMRCRTNVAVVVPRPKRLLRTRSRICAVSISGDYVHAGKAYFNDRRPLI